MPHPHPCHQLLRRVRHDLRRAPIAPPRTPPHSARARAAAPAAPTARGDCANSEEAAGPARRSRPMPVTLAVRVPGEEQPAARNSSKMFSRRSIGRSRRIAATRLPNHAQVGALEAAARVRQAVEPRVFGLRPSRAGGQFVRRPHRVKINHALRHIWLGCFCPCSSGRFHSPEAFLKPAAPALPLLTSGRCVPRSALGFAVKYDLVFYKQGKCKTRGRWPHSPAS